MFGRFRWGVGTAGALASVFGALELRVLETLWHHGEASVADVQAAFGNELAYTTLMTTLDRLYKKGALERRKDGRAFFYRCRRTRAEMERGVAARLMSALLGKGSREAEPVLSSLVEAVSLHDRELLDELQRLVSEKRRHLDKGSKL